MADALSIEEQELLADLEEMERLEQGQAPDELQSSADLRAAAESPLLTPEEQATAALGAQRDTLRAALPSESLTVGGTPVFPLARDTASAGLGGVLGVTGALSMGAPGMVGGAISGGVVGRQAVNLIADAVDYWVAGETGASRRNLKNDLEIGAMEGVLGLATEAVPLPGKGQLLKSKALLARQAKQEAAKIELKEAIAGTTKRFISEVTTKGDIRAGGSAQSVVDLINLDYQPLKNFDNAENLFRQVAEDIGHYGDSSALGGELSDEVLNRARQEMDDISSMLPEDRNFRVGREIGEIIDEASLLEDASSARVSRADVDKLLEAEEERLIDAYKSSVDEKTAIRRQYAKFRKNLSSYGAKDGSVERLSFLKEKKIPELESEILKLEDVVSKQEPGLISPEFLEKNKLQRSLNKFIQESADLEAGLPGTLSIRDLQDFKVDSARVSRDAYDLTESDRGPIKKVFTSASNALNRLIDDRMSLIDNKNGTNFLPRLAEKKQLFGALKEFVPIANELKLLEKAGKLSERATVGRIKGLGSSSLVTQGGAILGGGLGATFGGGFTSGAIGSMAGMATANAIANKKLASRLMRINTSLSRLRSADSASGLFASALPKGASSFGKASAINVVGRDIEKLVSSPDSVSDALFLTLAQENGLVSADGEPTDLANEQLFSEIDNQADQIMAPVLEAIKYGDEQDVALAASGLAKSFPEAFPKSKSGIKGEVVVSGVSKLPMIEDRAKYSQILADDPNLSDKQKAQMRSAVHKDGTIIGVSE